MWGNTRKSGRPPGAAVGGLAVAAALLPTVVRAQGTVPAPVSEVVVTAERRETPLQKTPAAISAIAARTLDAGFVNDAAGLNAIVPSLEVTHASGFENLVAIRGVGSQTPENALVTSPGVALFVDGVYIANTISLDQTLFDVDRVEVLRGPQGVLYGQSATGGAIAIVTRQPRLGVFQGSGDAAFGTYALFRERAEVNLPLGDTLALRVSAQAFDHDGFTRNLAIPGVRLDDQHDMSGKLALLWKPNAAFSATLTGMAYHADQNGAAQKNIAELAVPELQNPRVVDQDYPSTFDLTTQLYHLNLQWDGPAFTVKSVTAYQQLDHVQREDGSRSAYARFGRYDDVAAWNTGLKNYTEGLDVFSRPGGRWDWMVGGFALVQTSRQFVVEYEGASPPGPAELVIPPDVETAPPSNLAYGNDARLARQSYSAYGQLTWHATPRLRLTVGGRVNHDAYVQDALNFSAYAVDRVSHGYRDTVGTWRAQADYDVTASSLAYASVTRGYKPGGVNGVYGQLVIPDTFAPETNTSFELGSKTRAFGRALQLDLAAFYAQYRDQQYIETDPVPFDGGIANIPSVHTYGLEGEGSWTGFGGRLRLEASGALENGFVEGSYRTIDSTVANSVEQTAACGYGYNRACYPLVIASALDIGGRTPPDMPKLSGALAAAWRFDTPAAAGLPSGRLTPRIQYVYRGGEWARVFNDPALDRIAPYGVVNFDLEYAPGSSGLSLRLTATNLTDIAGVNSRYTDPYGSGQTSQQYIAPRQIVGVIAYAF